MKPLQKAKALLNKPGNWLARIYKDMEKPLSLRLQEQSALLSLLGLGGERDEIIEHLNTALEEAGLAPYNENRGMYSEHLVIFAAISKSIRYQPKSILEIGTYDGKTATLLARLFPNALITTIDLEDDDPLFKGSYKRDEEASCRSFIDKRDALLKHERNICQIQKNSLWLSRQKNSKYDLIWLDGAHGYPVACCDITNAVRMLSQDGILMCDDVYVNTKTDDATYKSKASWETLSQFAKAGILSVDLLRKRLGSEHLIDEKYVSFSCLRQAS